jgi:hypothetical protein
MMAQQTPLANWGSFSLKIKMTRLNKSYLMMKKLVKLLYYKGQIVNWASCSMIKMTRVRKMF